VTRAFMEDLRTTGGGTLERLGVVGHCARAVVFAVVGWFLVRAAVEYDPDEARGLAGALRTLAAEEWGSVVLWLVALGLVAYGAFAALSARHQKLPWS
ncbi:MAG: DUF1206 domain-containing protein, partial [Acidimicrobiia bacterium]|nr:DUF1206 domain-containing protein [Acidimicrobiia bacterium]